MQNYVRATVKDCKVLRISPTEARFLHKDEKTHVRLYGVCFENGEFWFMQDSQEHYYDSDTGEDFQKLFGEEFIDSAAVERLNKDRWKFSCINENLPEFTEVI